MYKAKCERMNRKKKSNDERRKKGNGEGVDLLAEDGTEEKVGGLRKPSICQNVVRRK